MARRKDSKPTIPPVRIGRARPTIKGGTWRVRAYAPTPGATFGRVSYRKPGTGRQTSAVPGAGESLDDLFEQVERALDEQTSMSTAATDSHGQTHVQNLEALSELYLDYLRLTMKSDGYVRNRECLVRKWIVPVVGHVLVRDWTPEDSVAVLNNMRAAGLSPGRVEDLGSTLTGMRKTAHRKRAGGRWLSPNDNPLEEVSYASVSRTQGGHQSYVPLHKRPSTDLVRKAIAAANELPVWDWMPDAVSIAGFCALRLGEQIALRPFDIDLTDREIDVNGTWQVARKAEVAGARRVRWRGRYTKNGKDRRTPYLGSQHEMLVTRCREALGLPDDASQATVAAAIATEQGRRALLTESGDWRDFVVSIDEEVWLFVDHSGVPPTKEAFNDAWHRVRDATGWPKSIKYKNMRHHAALFWRNEMGEEWEIIADWDGHDVKTLMKYYVLPAHDATRAARARLDAL